MPEFCSLWLGRYFCRRGGSQRLGPCLTQIRNAQRRGGQRADKTLKVYIFLAQKNTCFILQTKSASLPGILQPPNGLHKEPNFLFKTDSKNWTLPSQLTRTTWRGFSVSSPLLVTLGCEYSHKWSIKSAWVLMGAWCDSAIAGEVLGRPVR